MKNWLRSAPVFSKRENLNYQALQYVLHLTNRCANVASFLLDRGNSTNKKTAFHLSNVVMQYILVILFCLTVLSLKLGGP